MILMRGAFYLAIPLRQAPIEPEKITAKDARRASHVAREARP
jgi:hypothetical protein